MLNTQQILEIAQKYANAIKDASYSKLESEMMKRDREVGGRGQISRNLLQSIVAIVEGSPNFLEVGIEFDSYGVFVDEGVKGSESTYKESASSPYKFTSKMPPTKVFAGAGGWISRKAIIDRGDIRRKSGKSGKSLSQLVKNKNKQLAFVIARSVKEKGIKGYHFTDEIYKYLDNFTNEISSAIQQDLVIFVANEIRQLNKNK